MEKVFYIILIILGTGLLVDNIYREYIYSPKAQIKRLWKEIFNLAHQIGEHKNLIFDDKFINELDDETKAMLKDPTVIRELTGDDQWTNTLNRAINKRYIMINAMLDYYFNPEKDENYIKDNRPQKSK